MIAPLLPLSGPEHLRIIGMRVYSFLREFCETHGDPLANLLETIARRNEDEVVDQGRSFSRRGEATVADLLEAPDRPLLFEDTVEQILGCDQATPVVIDRVFGRLNELGLTPDPLGFSTLPMRVRGALTRSNIGDGAPKREDVAAYYDRSGLEGVRLALLHKGAATPHIAIAHWLGHPVNQAGRADLTAKVDCLETQLAAADEKLATLRLGVRVRKYPHLVSAEV